MVKTTVCARDCYDSCVMSFELDNSGNLLRVFAPKDHPITQGFLCKRGNAEIKRIFTNRIDQPYLRKNGNLVPIDWDTALDILAEKLQQTIDKYGSEKILYITYDGNAGLIHNQFVHRIWHRLEVTLTDMAICTTTGHTILKLHYGESNGITPSQLPDQKLIVFWGMNAAVSGQHIWAKALKARRNGAKIITIDPVKTITARHSDLWLQPKPNTDAALALFVIAQIIRQNKHNKQFIEKYTTGFKQLKQAAEKWDIEKTAQFTGIERSKLAELVESYVNLRPSATMIGVALQKREYGWEHIRAVSFIQAVLGYHRHFFYSNGQAFYIDFDYITGAKFHRTPNIIPQVATAKFVKQGAFKLIYVSSMNPAQTITNTKDFIAGIKQNNVFLAVADTHWSRTAKMADLVLPAPTFVEKPDVIVSWSHCYTRYSEAVINPLYNSRTEVEIMRQLAQRLGLKDWYLYQDPVQALRIAMDGAFVSDKTLKTDGSVQKLKTKPLDVYPTASGKIQFCLPDAGQLGINPTASQPPTSFADDQLLLLSTAVADYTNSQFVEVFGKPAPELHINPADAEKFGLIGQQTVLVYNGQDSVRLKLKVSQLVPAGVVWLPRAIDDLDGKPINNLIAADYQILGKGPLFHSTYVKLKAQTER